MIDVYDKAYRSLTKGDRPAEFRQFLLKAPTMFTDLGQCLGGLQHLVSFWRFRFPVGRAGMISPGELMDTFLDFEDSLAAPPDPRQLWIA